jgi:hypothetical protein
MSHILGFVFCAYPFAILESALGRGATLMIESRAAQFEYNRLVVLNDPRGKHDV